jgi:BASS family bile acid:Na+ symporter
MPVDVLKTVVLPLAVMVIMFGMGMGLRVEDFRQVFVSPRAKWLGLGCQLLMLPALAFGLVYAFGLQGELAVGLILVAACPGGAMSNVISHLARGDTALSVTLTALSSVVAVFSLPLVVGFASGIFLGESSEVTLPFGRTVLQIAGVTMLPIALGMALNAARPALCRRWERTFQMLSLGFVAVVVLIGILREEQLARQFAEAGPAAIALNVLGMAIGMALATAMGLARPQRVTITVEVGIQNGALALAIALGIMENPRIAMPAVVYSLIMLVTGAWMIHRYGRIRTGCSSAMAQSRN